MFAQVSLLFFNAGASLQPTPILTPSFRCLAFKFKFSWKKSAAWSDVCSSTKLLLRTDEFRDKLIYRGCFALNKSVYLLLNIAVISSCLKYIYIFGWLGAEVTNRGIICHQHDSPVHLTGRKEMDKHMLAHHSPSNENFQVKPILISLLQLF